MNSDFSPFAGITKIAETHIDTQGRKYDEVEMTGILKYIEEQQIACLLLQMAMGGEICIVWDSKNKKPLFKLSRIAKEKKDKEQVESLISSLKKG